MEAVKEEKASDDPTISDGWVAAHGPEQGVIVIGGQRATMLQLTENLQRLLQTSVLDRTGLAGRYNFEVQFARGDDPSDYTRWWRPLSNSGLKLEKYKGPVEFLVIDHLDRLAEN
ncbi:MAG: TIGR03435 family protein [Ignavibacteriota bacterium]